MCRAIAHSALISVKFCFLLAKRRVLLCAKVISSLGRQTRVSLEKELTLIQVDAITKIEKNTSAELNKTCDHLKGHDGSFGL